MKVSKISFKRALTLPEQAEYKSVLAQARNVANDGGKSVLIVHDTCLPQVAATDTGVGHLTSKSSEEFFDFAKNYMGINTVEVLPQGELYTKHTKGFYNGYNGSALSLGSHTIDLELLTTPEYHSILPQKEFQKVVSENARTQTAGLANYENVVGRASAQEKALRTAFENFQMDSSIDKTAFEAYKKANMDWLEPKSIYPILREKHGGKNWADWTDEVDKTLFDGVSGDSQIRIAEIKAKHGDEIEFYKFKQFLADEHLKAGRQKLNGKGMKLFGDCLIGFADDETWAFKKAFKKGAFIGLPEWGLPALDYDTIMQPNSASQKLLRRKVELFAQRYDGIRFDCSWCYVKPKLSDKSSFEFKGSLLDIIEDTAKKVKGSNFDASDLIHEFEADPKDFSIMGRSGKVLPYLKKHVKVVGSAYLDANYGSTSAMKKIGLEPDEYMLGVGNHDPQPLRQISDNIPEQVDGKLVFRRAKQASLLEKLMGAHTGEYASPSGFSRAKFAEPLMGKNQMVFYMDALGRAERFDSQLENGMKNYRYRIPMTYLSEYEKTVQDGFGYNPMDAYEKVFKAKGLNKTQSALYQKIVKFRDIMQEKATDVIGKMTKSKELARNKMLNIGAIVVALGLVTTVLASTQSSLQNQPDDVIYTKK